MGAIISGVIFLAVGLTVRVYPNILAGYNNLSQKEQENAVNNRLPFFGFILFTAMGIISILAYAFSIWLENPKISSNTTVIVTLAGAVIAVVGGNYLKSSRIN